MSDLALVTPSTETVRPRTADYTIQGFLYQFNKTLLEILRAPLEAEITIEGIVEDIEVAATSGLTAIQCKYHETQDNFVASSIYKPLLQMMHHFYMNRPGQIRYILFAHFPSLPPGSPSPVGKAELEAALKSEQQGLQRYTTVLRGNIDLDEFLSIFSMEFGPRFDTLVDDACLALLQEGIPQGDVDALAYPNAIHIIAGHSIKHDLSSRKLTKASLLESLHTIRKTTISRWTLGLRTRKKILSARRQQLKTNLDKNARLRNFLVSPGGLEDFETGIVMFISDYLDKYHSKQAHISTPLVCLDTSEIVVQAIQSRLYSKGIVCETGLVGTQFNEHRFLRTPMVQKDRERGVVHREFSVRLIRWNDSVRDILDRHKCDDLFLLGTDDLRGIVIRDVNIEVLAATSLKEVSYMMGVNNVCE